MICYISVHVALENGAVLRPMVLGGTLHPIPLPLLLVSAEKVGARMAVLCMLWAFVPEDRTEPMSSFPVLKQIVIRQES